MAVKTSWAAGDVLTAADLTDTFAAKAPLALSINAQTGTSYTLAVADSGRVVTMTNAAASTVTIPTNASVAVPIGSSVEVVNLSTGVNTTVSAAGGVTFNGGPVVLSPGSSVTLVKIGTDAWMAQGQGSPGLVHIATASLSGSSVSINNCFTSTYVNYRVIINSVRPSATTNLNMRLRASGTDATGAFYNTFCYQVAGTTAGLYRVAAGTQFDVGPINTGFDYGTIIDLMAPQLAENTNCSITGLGRNTLPDSTAQFGGLIHYVASAYDGFTLYPGSGTFTGTVRVYGYRN